MLRIIRHTSCVYVVAAIASILLSCWAGIREVVINPDAICYLQSAETVKDGIRAAMHLCDQAKWPFYPVLIFISTKITHASSFFSASLLDGLFSLISVLTFIAIVQFLKVPQRVLWMAALVILFAHEFNAVRVYIVRDHGFWAFYLLSIYFLLHYFRKPQWYTALAWNISLVLATVFRIEGMLFLMFLPFISWLNIRQKWSARLQSFLQLNSLILLIFAVVGVWVAYHSEQVMENLGRIGEVEFQVLHGIDMVVQHFRNSATMLAQHVLSPYAAGDAGLVLFLMLGSWYLVSIANNISFIYAALVIYAWYEKLLKTDYCARLVLWAYVVINFLITSIFLTENMFLSKRYILALSLTLMIWVPFALDGLMKLWQQRRWPLILALIFILASSVSGVIDFGYSKAYIRDAGDWLADHAPMNAQIYSNDYQVMYYSHHFGNSIFDKSQTYANINFIEDQKWKQFDYVALRFNKKDLDHLPVVKEINLIPAKAFSNSRGDQVVIYYIPHDK